MAVQHGYGKIAGADALVFAYDAGDTVNSYKGEPTTNLATLDLNNTSVWYNEDPATTTRELQPETLFGYPVYKIASRPGSIWITPVAFNGYNKANGPITASVYIRNLGAPATVSTYLSGDYSTDSLGNSNYKTIPTDGVWRRYSWTRTADDMNTANQLEFRTSGNNIQISCPQVEYKLHPTPIVEGTREIEEGLKDLTGNTSVDLTNVSFDSNAQVVFDGTDDYINTDYSQGNITNPTIEAVVYRSTDPGRYEAIVQNNTASDDALYVYPNQLLGFWPCVQSNLLVPAGQWSHVAVSYDGTNLTYIVNGVTQVITTTCSHIQDWDFLRIGAYSTGDGERWIGEIPVVKVYNRALSIEELKQNFNHYKTRFNIL
jgi:hypothetical protein